MCVNAIVSLTPLWYAHVFLQNIILPDKDMSLCDMDIFNGHLVLFLNKKGLPLLCSLNFPIQIDFKVYYLISIIMKLM